MSGLADGFFKGFNTVENHFQRQKNNEHRDRAFGLQEQQAQRQADAHKMNMASAGIRNDLAQKELDNYDEQYQLGLDAQRLGMSADKASIKASNARTSASNTQNELNGLKVQSYKSETQKKKKQEDQRLAFEQLTNMIDAQKAGINVNPERIMQLHESVKGTQFDFLFDPMKQDAIQSVSRDFSQTGKLSSETLQKLNNGGLPELKAAIGKPSRFGAPITDVAIVNVTPEGGSDVSIDLMVQDQKGNVYRSKVNELRDADSSVKKINSESLMKHYMAQGMILDEAKKTGFLEKANGFVQAKSRRLQAQSGRGGQLPAKIQEFEYIRSMVGQEALEDFILYGKGKSPQAIAFEANKIAHQIVSKDIRLMNASPEERQQAIDQLTGSLMSNFTDQPQGSKNPQADSDTVVYDGVSYSTAEVTQAIKVWMDWANQNKGGQ